MSIETEQPDPLHHSLRDAFPPELLAELAGEAPEDEDGESGDA